METSDLSAQEARELSRVWWAFLGLGLVSVVAGAILVAKPSHSLTTLAVVFGIFLLIDGIVELIRSIAGTIESPALGAIVGILGVIVGLVLIRHPTHGVTAVGLLIGIWLVAAGVMRLVRAIAGPRRGVLTIGLALLEIVVGIVVVSDPHIGYATLAVLCGLWLIVSGIGTIILAVAIRRLGAAAGGTRGGAGATAS